MDAVVLRPAVQRRQAEEAGALHAVLVPVCPGAHGRFETVEVGMKIEKNMI